MNLYTSLLDLLEQHWEIVVLLSLGSIAVSLILLPLVLIRLPTDFLLTSSSHPILAKRYHPVVALTLIVLRNALGFILVISGILLLFLPGQGLLTVLGGLILMDFPKKHVLIQKMLQRPALLRAVNWLRERAGHPRLKTE